MDILLRGVPDELAERIGDTAKAAGVTRLRLLLDLLQAQYGEPQAVVGWVRFDRPGELDPDAACPECGQALTEVWAGMLANGQWIAPRCKWCAVSE